MGASSYWFSLQASLLPARILKVGIAHQFKTVILWSQGMLEVAFTPYGERTELVGVVWFEKHKILFLERGVWGGLNAGTRNLE